ncbi:hypothetical protein [Ferruginibacter sp.]
MKIIFIFFAFLSLKADTLQATVDSAVLKHFRHIVQLIRSGNAAALSKKVEYPIKRSNPLPDIQNAKQFIAYYPTLFDSAFKELVKQYHDSIVFEHHDLYGLVGGGFIGEIWINEEGKIVTVNYSSQKEQSNKQQLDAKIKRAIYPGINTWDDNVLVARSEKLLLRIDRTAKGLRYVCWSKGQPTNEKPDIILYNGVEEQQGTMGGWTYTFQNDGWTYIIEDAAICDDPKNCGLFLQLLFDEKVKSNIKLKEIKQ